MDFLSALRTFVEDWSNLSEADLIARIPHASQLIFEMTGKGGEEVADFPPRPLTRRSR